MTNVQTNSSNVSTYWLASALVMFIVTATMLPNMAYATSGGFDFITCGFAGWMLGNTGRGMAILAVAILGIGASLGKISWGIAIVVAVGISAIFGAAALVTMVGGLYKSNNALKCSWE
jgi:type IV secretory pathway VirB2 component (pilin)